MVASSLVEVSHTQTSATKIKEIVIDRPGTVDTSFYLKDGSSNAKGQIYRNGSAVGAVKPAGTSYTECTDTTSGWKKGDLLQLYTYVFAGGPVLAKNLVVKSNVAVAMAVAQETYPHV